MGLSEVQRYKSITYSVVRFIEIVIDVPADFSEFLSFLDDCMEKGEYVEHRFKLCFGTAVENVIGELRIGLLDVLTETIRGFCNHFKGFLQNT